MEGQEGLVRVRMRRQPLKGANRFDQGPSPGLRPARSDPGEWPRAKGPVIRALVMALDPAVHELAAGPPPARCPHQCRGVDGSGSHKDDSWRIARFRMSRPLGVYVKRAPHGNGQKPAAVTSGLSRSWIRPLPKVRLPSQQGSGHRP